MILAHAAFAETPSARSTAERPISRSTAPPKLDIRHIVLGEGEQHPSAANGVHQVARSLATEQSLAGHETRIVFLAGDTDRFEAPAGIRLDHIEAGRRTILGRRFEMRSAAVELVLDGAGANTIYHIHGARQPRLLPIVRALGRRGIPYVITLHSRFSHVYGSDGRLLKPVTALYVALLERPFLNRAAFVHVLTDLETSELRRLAPAAKARLVPNGSFSSAVGGEPRAPERRQPSRAFPVFGFCGRIAVFHKGLDLLVEGFAGYRRDGGRGRLVVMGTGPERARLADLARELDIEADVSLEEPRFGSERDEVVRTWDFFALPSRLDHMPIAALEAALLGVPLLITAETGLHDTMGEHGAGLLIEGLTARQVAAAMTAAANLPPSGWAAMSRGAHEMARRTSDWTVSADRLTELYRTSFATRPGKGSE